MEHESSTERIFSIQPLESKIKLLAQEKEKHTDRAVLFGSVVLGCFITGLTGEGAAVGVIATLGAVLVGSSSISNTLEAMDYSRRMAGLEAVVAQEKLYAPKISPNVPGPIGS